MRWMILVTFAGPALLVIAPAHAQTTAARAAYAPRIETLGRNNVATTSAKVNTRLDTRIDARIDTRITRDRLVGADPTAAFTAARERLTKPVAPVQPMPPTQDNPQ